MTDPDPLDALLAPPALPSHPELREAVFRQTQRTLARGRIVRRLTTAGLVAAVFAVGGLGGWVAKPDRWRVETVASPAEVVVVTMPVPVLAGGPEPSPGVEPAAPPLTAARVELLAEQADDPADAAKLYRLAGDKYLNDVQDYRNAARCYRLYLSRAGDSGLSLEPGDTWLLTSLKNLAFKEKFDVAKTDG